MSIEAISRVLPIQGLSAQQKLCLIGIANHDGDGGSWPSIDTLATYVGVSVRQAQRIVRSLEEAGRITVERNAGGNAKTPKDRRPNLYRLIFDGVTPVTPRDERGDISAPYGVTFPAERGDTAMSPEPSRTTQEPSNTHAQPSVEPWQDRNFQEFWTMYPRKVGKRDAQKALIAACKRELPAVIATALQKRIDYWEQHKTPIDKIPHPATWLNQDRWLDEIEGTAKWDVRRIVTMAVAMAHEDRNAEALAWLQKHAWEHRGRLAELRLRGSADEEIAGWLYSEAEARG